MTTSTSSVIKPRLTALHIRNFAVVKSLDIEFNSGMTAITGETGAGKSIALDALGLCLGDRADIDSIRPGADKAEVTASFMVHNNEAVLAWLAEQELIDPATDHQLQDEECIIRRIVTREGRSKAWLNGQPVTMGQLKALAPHLVNIHGQHEHQLLTREDHQLTLLDGYARHQPLLSQVVTDYQQWYQAKAKLKQLEAATIERQAKFELLSYQVRELDEFALQPGEFEQIEEQHKRQANSQGLREDSLFALNALYEGEHNSAFSLIQAALERLESQLDSDPQLQTMVAMLRDAGVQIEESARELRRYQETIDVDPQQLVLLEQRLTQAMQLARKHQVAPAALPALQGQLQQELDRLTAADEDQAELKETVQRAAKQYRLSAQKLSESRQLAATELSKKITHSMQQLNMPHGRFVIQVTHESQAPATKWGTDNIEFQVSANPGQPLQALAKVASGGELSRISLAIQVITAAQQTTPTLMFDEVDVGVSGATAATVGKLLRELGEHAQIICVTHLPQVAAKAHQQMLVQKVTDGEHTETHMYCLSQQDRVDELARLLGGDAITAATRANAQELLL